MHMHVHLSSSCAGQAGSEQCHALYGGTNVCYAKHKVVSGALALMTSRTYLIDIMYRSSMRMPHALVDGFVAQDLYMLEKLALSGLLEA